MREFGSPFPADGHTLSIKVRVDSGCFHREHSPQAYRIIDEYLASTRQDSIRFEEHESGPELLVWLAMGTATITLAKSVIDLVTAIIKARSEGIRKGDHPAHPVELIVRNLGLDGQVKEERILRFAPDDPVNGRAVQDAMEKATAKLLPPAVSDPAPSHKPRSKKPTGPKRKSKGQSR
jgi:hypothetical protein